METITTAGTSQKHVGLLYPLMLIAAIALIIFSILGIATMMGWMPGALPGGHSPDKAGLAPRADAAPACDDCGIVESIREAEAGANAKGAGTYQVRVRMGNGVTRTFYESRRPALAIGQRVRVTERGIAPAG